MTKTFQPQPATPIKRPKEERYTTLHAMDDLRRQWYRHFDGNLCTICRDDHPLAGYPVGSVVPYILDDQSRPIILIAHIAEHTQNAIANPKASLFIRENKAFGDVQTQWRICAIGDLQPVPEEALPQLSERYFRHYPKARHYDTTHQFRFYRLTPKKFRIIMGFGDIRWIAADAPFANIAPFEQNIIDRMCAHMNNDHQDAMQTYLKQQGIPPTQTIEMTHITPYGATLKHGDGLHFIAFTEPSTTPEAVRKALVALAKE
ncbi:HugZ family protein [Suttonella ornithocola]|uniref:Heme oxygenase, HugZ family n=1 Tax=Suttonella ornithocola TaxID=279832 RepID=A0A380MKQ7_9GAMM|nr:DUF2470 domain-containing protein [Suttonella ornithocola]SUO93225.1 heme oxygenase, HugZ family [Suttonella ornithocola]